MGVLDGLDRPHLAIGVLERDESHVHNRHRSNEQVKPDPPMLVDRDRIEGVRPYMMDGIGNHRGLDSRGDNPKPAGPGGGKSHDEPLGGNSGRGSEMGVSRVSDEQRRHLFPDVVKHLLCPSSFRMQTSRIGPTIVKRGKVDVPRLPVDGHHTHRICVDPSSRHGRKGMSGRLRFGYHDLGRLSLEPLKKRRGVLKQPIPDLPKGI